MGEALFKYRVRVTERGRHVRLRVTVRDGLEVIVPRGYDLASVPEILKRKSDWVSAALDRASVNRKFIEPRPKWMTPNTITLPAAGEVWHVVERETSRAG